MGAPYHMCKASLSGSWVPRLPDDGDGFQDLKSWSTDNQHLALVRWNISVSNDPGFNIVVISLIDHSIQQSRRLKGCCRSISWVDARITYSAFAEIRGSFSPRWGA